MNKKERNEFNRRIKERLLTKIKQKVEFFALLDNNYTDKAKELLYEINQLVMSADGTAEGWSYPTNPKDYLCETIEIFELTKNFFRNESTLETSR